MTALPTSRLLPLLMVMAFLMLGVRGYDFWAEWSAPARAAEGPAHPAAPAAASADAAPAPAAAPKPPEVAPPTEAAGSTMLGTGDATTPPAADANAAAPVDENMPGEYTPAEVAVLQTLGQRRAELDRRAGELDQREALLQAAQQSVEDKVKELEGLRTELQNLLHTVDTQQQERIASLVKIYETMKPREAAAILETLDMQVALDVMEQMKETKSAPILAAMDPQKASAITVEMSRRNQLPQIPQ